VNKIVFIIGLGGFIGTIARYLSHQFVHRYYPLTFPYGTLAVNLLGCFLIGIFYGLSVKGNLLSPEWRMFLTTGFCGGFTTFSAFTLESVNLMYDRQYLYVGIYAAVSVVVGIAATYSGIWLTKYIV